MSCHCQACDPPAASEGTWGQMQTVHCSLQGPSDLCPGTLPRIARRSPLYHPPALLTSLHRGPLSFSQHIQHNPTPGPLHLPPPLPGVLSSSSLSVCHLPVVWVSNLPSPQGLLLGRILPLPPHQPHLLIIRHPLVQPLLPQTERVGAGSLPTGPLSPRSPPSARCQGLSQCWLS